jgi:hypothetical protein
MDYSKSATCRRFYEAVGDGNIDTLQATLFRALVRLLTS